jgi:hypothetical protein
MSFPKNKNKKFPELYRTFYKVLEASCRSGAAGHVILT